MASFGKQKFARQADFDALVGDLVQEGSTLEDAATEALEIFAEEYETSSLFVYKTATQQADKNKLQTQCLTVEKVVAGTETEVNCIFAYQGLKQALSTEAGADVQSWRLVEDRKLVVSLVKVLQVKEKDDAEKDGEDHDDSDEDEDEDAIHFFVATLDLLLHIAYKNKFLSAERAFTLPSEAWAILAARFDASIDEIRVVDKLIQIIFVLISQPENKEIFKSECGGTALLDLCAKLHKKNEALSNQITMLIGLLSI